MGGRHYLLTPQGIEQKVRMTVEFQHLDLQEYERLKAEIEELRHEAEQQDNQLFQSWSAKD
ncbi:MAG: hypothetical protein A2W28_03380 [Gammaproteobacteria bacterium RBG_16_51_14]|nr:MAG: hypothetical protein A2W28_03380 [Gammaproteobacteria bacterium RBG_16_51_14]